MLTCKHSKFTLPPQVTYLNCAYMSPLLKNVEKVGVKALRRKRNPTKISPADFFTDNEKLREEYAKLINCSNPKRIVMIPSVSYGMATVTTNLKIQKGQNIVIAAEQFPSNYYPWKRLCDENSAEIKVVSAPKTLESRGKKWNEEILAAINSSTAAVALGNVHWADGTLFNLEAIRKETRDVGAWLIVDGTQSVGALPFDIQKIRPDALVCAGYKWLLGPYSSGLAYYGSVFDNGKPVEENWINRNKSEDFSALVNYEDEYQPGALRFEMGERSNFIAVPMLSKAIEQLNNWRPDRIQEYCHSISQKGIGLLRNAGYWIEEEGYRSSHLFGVRLPQSADLQKIKEALTKKKIFVSYRGDSIRVAPNVYNDESDLLKFAKTLISVS
ncbi:MAG: aminotransferase class V-fold PLP-dependent enzyme [Flammeovirgaceae bacterium]|nr:aminotransferase class V-fold PLP-dependent enzyme [Flammeovirgaceae bacterium]